MWTPTKEKAGWFRKPEDTSLFTAMYILGSAIFSNEYDVRLFWLWFHSLHLDGKSRPETLFISHEQANFLFSVFRVVQGEAKTQKNGVLQGNFCIFTCPKDWHFSWKMNIRMRVENLTIFPLAIYFLINSKLAFSLHVSERCQTGTAKKNWFRAQNSLKNNFLLLRLETSLAWKFLFLCSSLKNYPWMFEKNSFFNQLWT